MASSPFTDNVTDLDATNLNAALDSRLDIGVSATHKLNFLIAYKLIITNDSGTNKFQLFTTDIETDYITFNGTIGGMPDADVSALTVLDNAKVQRDGTGAYTLRYDTFEGWIEGHFTGSDTNITQVEITINASSQHQFRFLTNAGALADIASGKAFSIWVTFFGKAT